MPLTGVLTLRFLGPQIGFFGFLKLGVCQLYNLSVHAMARMRQNGEPTLLYQETTQKIRCISKHLHILDKFHPLMWFDEESQIPSWLTYFPREFFL